MVAFATQIMTQTGKDFSIFDGYDDDDDDDDDDDCDDDDDVEDVNDKMAPKLAPVRLFLSIIPFKLSPDFYAAYTPSHFLFESFNASKNATL